MKVRLPEAPAARLHAGNELKGEEARSSRVRILTRKNYLLLYYICTIPLLAVLPDSVQEAKANPCAFENLGNTAGGTTDQNVI
jgi:hypothetical protein